MEKLAYRVLLHGDLRVTCVKIRNTTGLETIVKKNKLHHEKIVYTKAF